MNTIFKLFLVLVCFASAAEAQNIVHDVRTQFNQKELRPDTLKSDKLDSLRVRDYTAIGGGVGGDYSRLGVKIEYPITTQFSGIFSLSPGILEAKFKSLYPRIGLEYRMDQLFGTARLVPYTNVTYGINNLLVLRDYEGIYRQLERHLTGFTVGAGVRWYTKSDNIYFTSSVNWNTNNTSHIDIYRNDFLKEDSIYDQSYYKVISLSIGVMFVLDPEIFD